MLVLARESRGMTQKDLADATGISQGNISKYESGLIYIKEEHISNLMNVLGYSGTFFELPDRRYGFGVSCTYHRRRASMPIQELKSILARVNVLRIHIGRLLNGAEIECATGFRRIDCDDHNGDVEKIARMVRSEWMIPDGPIHNMVSVIERAGGIVFRCSFGTKKIDAISQWVGDFPPLFFVNSETPSDRSRFTLAHELGHVIMHSVTTESPEQEADRFAAEFLMPKSSVIGDLQHITFDDLVKLKIHWKVSMQAIIMRAKNLETITPWQYRALFERISRLGYRTREPIDLPIEQPTVLQDLINLHITEFGYSIDDLAKLLYISVAELGELYGISEKPHLRLITR